MLTEEITKKVANDTDIVVINFLKDNGYRPKLTTKYIKNLEKRLTKKGIYLDIEYSTVLHDNDDGIMKSTIHIIPSFKKL